MNVSGVSIDNERITDIVKSISKTSDGTVLNMQGGARIRMANVDTINVAGAQ
jgi:hypothetical protein